MVKTNRVLFYFIGAVSLILVLLYVQMSKAPKQNSNEIHVWAYGSFYSDYGPGNRLAAIFEKETGVRVVFHRIEEPGLFLKHLDFIPNQAVDVVINFDQWNVGAAIEKLNPVELKIPQIPWRPEIRDFVSEKVKPFDWAPMTWIYRKGTTPPKNWAELSSNPKFKNKIAVMSPITSSPGWLWYFWLVSSDRDGWEQNLKAFKAQSGSLQPDWSSSYGLFQNNNADLAFSYVTSLVYHMRVEKSDAFQAVSWDSGHPVQVEFVMVPERAQNVEAAVKFVHTMLSVDGQVAIRDKNFMYSVRADLNPTPDEERLPKLKLIPMTHHSEFLNNSRNWLEQFEKSWF